MLSPTSAAPCGLLPQATCVHSCFHLSPFPAQKPEQGFQSERLVRLSACFTHCSGIKTQGLQNGLPLSGDGTPSSLASPSVCHHPCLHISLVPGSTFCCSNSPEPVSVESGVLMFFTMLGCVGPAGWSRTAWSLLGLRFLCWSPQRQSGEEQWWLGSLRVCPAGRLTSVLVPQDLQQQHLRTTRHGMHVLLQPLAVSCVLMSHGPKQMV